MMAWENEFETERLRALIMSDGLYLAVDSGTDAASTLLPFEEAVELAKWIIERRNKWWAE